MSRFYFCRREKHRPENNVVFCNPLHRRFSTSWQGRGRPGEEREREGAEAPAQRLSSPVGSDCTPFAALNFTCHRLGSADPAARGSGLPISGRSLPTSEPRVRPQPGDNRWPLGECSRLRCPQRQGPHAPPLSGSRVSGTQSRGGVYGAASRAPSGAHSAPPRRSQVVQTSEEGAGQDAGAATTWAAALGRRAIPRTSRRCCAHPTAAEKLHRSARLPRGRAGSSDLVQGLGPATPEPRLRGASHGLPGPRPPAGPRHPASRPRHRPPRRL